MSLPSHHPDVINLLLRARHFDGSYHHDRINGAICACIRELPGFAKSYINNNEADTVIDAEIYLHKSFDESAHNESKLAAEKTHFDNSIIRTLTLTKLIQ